MSKAEIVSKQDINFLFQKKQFRIHLKKLKDVQKKIQNERPISLMKPFSDCKKKEMMEGDSKQKKTI